MGYLYSLVVFFVLLISINVKAQITRVGLNITGGIGFVGPLNQGSGAVFAIHPHYKQWNSTSIDGLISYSNIEKTDIVFFGKDRTFTIKSLNFMLGLRQYINPSESKNRFFINLLGGISRQIQVNSDNTELFSIRSAYSLGLYYEFKPLLIGAGIESPDVLFIRFGFLVL
jgi:hypothetical protein